MVSFHSNAGNYTERQLLEPWWLVYSAGLESLFGPCGPIFETSVVKYMFYAVVLIFYCSDRLS